jgi:hypothetical protein
MGPSGIGGEVNREIFPFFVPNMPELRRRANRN